MSENEKSIPMINGIPVNVNPAVQKSNERVRQLTKDLMDTIGKSVESSDEQFTTFEVVDALLVIAHSYNRRGLKMQHEDQNPQS